MTFDTTLQSPHESPQVGDSIEVWAGANVLILDGKVVAVEGDVLTVHYNDIDTPRTPWESKLRISVENRAWFEGGWIASVTGEDELEHGKRT